MRMACSLSAFRPPMPDALRQIAAMGFRYIDLLAIKGFAGILPGELAADWDGEAGRVEELLAKNRLTPIALNAAVGSLNRRDPAVVAQRLREATALARLMQRLGIGVAAFYPGYLVSDRPWEDVLRDTVTTLHELDAVAAAHGVRFGLELHYNTPFMTMPQCRRLVEVFPALNVVYDPSHFAMQGLGLRETEWLLDRTIHVHLRAAAPGRMQVHVDESTVDFDGLLGALKARGYAGGIAIEYLPSPEDDMRPDIVRTRDIIRRHFPDAG